MLLGVALNIRAAWCEWRLEHILQISQALEPAMVNTEPGLKIGFSPFHEIKSHMGNSKRNQDDLAWPRGPNSTQVCCQIEKEAEGAKRIGSDVIF